MKNTILNLLLVMLCLFTLPVSEALPQNSSDSFYCNPLLLNGKSMDFAMFSSVSMGRLSMVKGNPYSDSKINIPFYIYLIRAGKIVDADSYAHNNAVKEYEMAEILKSAKVGDQIIIDPADKNEEVGRRIIVVKQEQLGYRFQWFYGLNKKDDC